MDEPLLKVGLLLGQPSATIELDGEFDLEVNGRVVDRLDGSRKIKAGVSGDLVTLRDLAEARTIRLVPVDADRSSFLLRDMIVGVAFHWEHTEDLRFRGGVAFRHRGETLDVINEVPLEEYLISVVSSEMSAECPLASMEAHAVISRSWLLAQIQASENDATPSQAGQVLGEERDGVVVIRRWYDREDHVDFDVCADDHCQRYQGITRAFSEGAVKAVKATRGRVLLHDGEVCDARFSKCCGGMTEVFESAWGDEPQEYLQAFVDGEEDTFELPLTDELLASKFIDGAPAAFCNTGDRELLDRILPDIDHGTQDFYRWEEELSQEEVRRLVHEKSGFDPGTVFALEPLERGPSGRITRLAIRGAERTLEVGKELEIRRLLSTSHLYSSAFVVRALDVEGGVPGRFVLRGGGWGHGVGLCQIGAAVMAEKGYSYRDILAHYYRGAEVAELYD